MTYAEEQEEKLNLAMADYNQLYPDNPISKLGDTPDRDFHLLAFDTWRSGDAPLSADAIEAIEAETDGTGFS